MSKYLAFFFIFGLFIFASYQEFVYGQTITLKSYSQLDSDTRCTHGLISGVDNVVFKAGVDYTEDAALKYVHFYLLRNTDIIPLLYITLNLQENCQRHETYSCRRTSPTTLDIEIKVKASKDYSGAKIYGKLFTSESNEINSDYQQFPQIYDATDVSGRLIVNGKEIPINNEDCLIEVYEPQVNIVFVCKSQATPCWSEIVTNDSSTVQGVDFSIYNTKLEKLQDLFITIRYGVCSLNITVNNYVCKLNPDLRTSTISNSNEFDLLLQFQRYSELILLISVILVTLMLIVLTSICWVAIRSRKRRGQNPHGTPNGKLLNESGNSNSMS